MVVERERTAGGHGTEERSPETAQAAGAHDEKVEASRGGRVVDGLPRPVTPDRFQLRRRSAVGHDRRRLRLEQGAGRAEGLLEIKGVVRLALESARGRVDGKQRQRRPELTGELRGRERGSPRMDAPVRGNEDPHEHPAPPVPRRLRAWSTTGLRFPLRS